MFGSYLVELVIGLCFLFAVFGIVTSAVTEGVLTLLRTRGEHLQEWLEQWTAQLFDEDPTKVTVANDASKAFLKELQAHPLVASQGRGSERPSYLPSDQLAAAFLQLVGIRFGFSASTETKPAKTDETPGVLAGEGVRAAPTINETAETVRNDLETAVDSLRKHIDNDNLFPDGLKNALHTLLNNAIGKAKDGTTLAAAMKDETARWIDASMDRVEGWTKRHAKKISLLVAFVICLAFNVSVFEVLKVLSSDPKVRTELATTAVSYVAKDCDAVVPAPSASGVRQAGQSDQGHQPPSGAKAPAPAASGGVEPKAGNEQKSEPAASGSVEPKAGNEQKSEPAASGSGNSKADIEKKLKCLSEKSEAAVGALGNLSQLGIGWDRKPKFLLEGGAQATNTGPGSGTGSGTQATEKTSVWDAMKAAMKAAMNGDFDFYVWLAGVIFAAFAASLGGDFWFKWIGDIVRLTGYKPPKTGKDEAAADETQSTVGDTRLFGMIRQAK
jgi:hypothetical protein